MVTHLQSRAAPMIRTRLPYVWSLSEDLDVLGKLDTSQPIDRLDLMLALYGPQAALEGLLSNSVFSQSLRSSLLLADQLLKKLHEHTGRENYDGVAAGFELAGLKYAYEQFKIAFLSELGTLPSYFVSQKGSHDTLTLLDDPLRMFPDALLEKVPEAAFDVAQAGKALCYEMATACGFHLFRVTEAVLRRYYSHVTNGSTQPKVRNIMVYVQAMRQKKCGNEKILSVVEQMSKLHRNPLIHPEVALTIDEAISVLGIAHSAVTAMLAELPELPKTTASVQ